MTANNIKLNNNTEIYNVNGKTYPQNQGNRNNQTPLNRQGANIRNKISNQSFSSQSINNNRGGKDTYNQRTTGPVQNNIGQAKNYTGRVVRDGNVRPAVMRVPQYTSSSQVYQGRDNIRGQQNSQNYAMVKPSKVESAALMVAETIGEARLLMKDASALTKYNYKTIKVKEKKPIPKKLIFFSLACTMLAMFMVVSFVQVNEITLDIYSLNKKIEVAAKEEKELALEVDMKYSLYDVEEYAVKNLGMVKANQLKKVYLENSGEDTIETFETEEADKGVISTILSAIGNNFKSYWNIFYKSE